MAREYKTTNEELIAAKAAIEAGIKPSPQFDVEELRKAFLYDEDSGMLYRRYANGGKEAGTVHPGRFYQVMFKRQMTTAQRIVWALKTGVWPGPEVSINHKNGDKFDNRFENLECLSKSFNGVQFSDEGAAKMAASPEIAARVEKTFEENKTYKCWEAWGRKRIPGEPEQPLVLIGCYRNKGDAWLAWINYTSGTKLMKAPDLTIEEAYDPLYDPKKTKEERAAEAQKKHEENMRRLCRLDT